MTSKHVLLIKYMDDVKLAFRPSLDYWKNLRVYNTDWIGWKPPECSWTILNTDGSVRDRLNFVGGGGLLRDHEGCWIVGFSFYMGIFFILASCRSLAMMSSKQIYF